MTTLTSHPNNWIVDSSDSYHITSNLQNLFIHNDYRGNKDIIIDNGYRISITYTGSQYLIQTPIFLYSIMLCVFLILKEILFLFLNSVNKIISLLNSFLTHFL